ncbi:uncharacterized protein LOC129589928 [Paramacrobiotus metropolitanus]|uniref:uncharacterized protein LOC129589928 n=1 Tax=Paramacrobiotus metropolitanus TaxID=2943436 RepID=UPI002445EE71|nr:uncharacterized protein LOC129589928 [Paramacrobiotus metropolitanus]
MTKLIGLIVILSVCAVALAEDDPFALPPVAYLCRFYSNGEKRCQKKCTYASKADRDKLLNDRPASNDIPQKRLNDEKNTPLFFYKCSDPPVTSNGDVISKQQFASAFDDALRDAPQNKKTYLGTCILNNDLGRNWSCRGVSIDNDAGKTYIGGLATSGYEHRDKGKPSWKVTANGDVQFVDNDE